MKESQTGLASTHSTATKNQLEGISLIYLKTLSYHMTNTSMC